jgi:hypothetical protein
MITFWLSSCKIIAKLNSGENFPCRYPVTNFRVKSLNNLRFCTHGHKDITSILFSFYVGTLYSERQQMCSRADLASCFKTFPLHISSEKKAILIFSWFSPSYHYILFTAIYSPVKKTIKMNKIKQAYKKEKLSNYIN